MLTTLGRSVHQQPPPRLAAGRGSFELTVEDRRRFSTSKRLFGSASGLKDKSSPISCDFQQSLDSPMQRSSSSSSSSSSSRGVNASVNTTDKTMSWRADRESTINPVPIVSVRTRTAVQINVSEQFCTIELVSTPRVANCKPFSQHFLHVHKLSNKDNIEHALYSGPV